jgi:signal transduction histidine kinase/streptogramin lyase/ActR/RegA family two-component response regulator
VGNESLLVVGNKHACSSRRSVLLKAILLLGILLHIYSYGQLYQIHTYTDEEGLPEAMAYDVAQDNSGRMWFATRGGIACYDGVSWKTYTTADGLRQNSGLRLLVDRTGRIWVLPYFRWGVSTPHYFDGSRWQKVAGPDTGPVQEAEMAHFRVVGPEEGKNGLPVLAIGSKQHGLFLRVRDKWQHLSTANGLPGNNINGMAVLDRKLYAATDLGLAVIDVDKAGPLTADTGLNRTLDLPTAEVRGIGVQYKDKFPGSHLNRSRIWLLGREWIGCFDEPGRKITTYPMSYFNEDEGGVELLPDYRCGVYAGNEKRVLYFNYKTAAWDAVTIGSGLVGTGLTSMCIDFEKNIWISNPRGVSKIISRRFANYRIRNGLMEDEVTAVLEYEPGKFVLGHNKAMSFWEKGKIRHFSLEGKTGDDFQVCRVMDIKKDPQKNIWAALDGNGLIKLDPDLQVTWYGKPHGLGEQVNSICFDGRNNLWIGTKYNLLITGSSNFNPVPVKKLAGSGVRKIFKIANDAGEKLYFATWESGLFTFDDRSQTQSWEHFRLPGQNQGNNIYGLYKDSSSTLLLGTMDGVLTLDEKKKTLKRFSRSGFELHEPVFFITEDRSQRLWFGTLNGVVRWDGKEARRYSTAHGLAGRETNRAAGVVDNRGRLWIGTSRGLSIYNELFDDPATWKTPPKLHLTALSTDQRLIPLTGRASPVRLDADTHTLAFDFFAISFQDERGLRFRYKLEGFDNHWNDEYLHYVQTVRYPRPAPGRYRFRIESENIMGIWSETVSSPEIIIPTPFYNQLWFYLFLFTALVLMMFLVVRFITRLRYAAMLEKQVQERTAQLQIVQQQLIQAQKMEAIGTLAGGIAHDFNNILGVILGNAELVLDDLPEDTREYDNVENILKASKRASELVKQILAFSRQSKRERRAIDMITIANDALKLLRPSLPATIEIRRFIRAESAVILADATQMHQVIMNLCTNAAHAMREQGGILEIRLDNVYLDEEGVKNHHDIAPGPYVRLTVSDTGHGIPKVVMKRIFDPYFTTKDAGEGTGMGLAVIHGIVKSHSGDVSVYSKPGKGTAFHVFLPSFEGDESEVTKVSTVETLPCGSEHILLVDDESDLTEVGMQILNRLGYRVTGKSDPIEAVRTFTQTPAEFDMVITDFTMPKMTGIQVAETIKDIAPHIPVILCSGFHASIPEEKIKAYVDDFVMKPIVKSELAQVVRDVLNRKKGTSRND